MERMKLVEPAIYLAANLQGNPMVGQVIVTQSGIFDTTTNRDWKHSSDELAATVIKDVVTILIQHSQELKKGSQDLRKLAISLSMLVAVDHARLGHIVDL
jgi:hypothetical protein